MQSFELLPEVAADAATVYSGSDRYPATVLGEHKGIVSIQYDDDRVVEGSMVNGSAKYVYHRNRVGRIAHYKLYKGKYEEVIKNDATGRYNKVGGRMSIGQRSRYYDPHF